MYHPVQCCCLSTAGIADSASLRLERMPGAGAAGLGCSRYAGAGHGAGSCPAVCLGCDLDKTGQLKSSRTTIALGK